GICRIKDGAIKLWTARQRLPDSHVVWGCVDNQGVGWAGLNTGIARLKNGKLVAVSRNQGLFDNIIHAILPDNHGHVWVDSSRGFFSFATQDFDEFASGKTDHVTCADCT